MEAVLEWVVIAKAGRAAAIFEGSVVDAVAAAHNELRRDLISETDTRREIIFRDNTQAGAVGIGVDEVNAVLGQEIGEAGRQGWIVFAAGGNDILRTAEGSAGNEVRLRVYRSYYGAYFQDDWKVTSKLTLNLGVRWDWFSATGERYNAQANLVPGTPFSGAQYIIPASRKDNPALSSSFTNLLAKDGINLVYSDAYGSGLSVIPKNNFAPRIGFAYQVSPKFVCAAALESLRSFRKSRRLAQPWL